MKYKMVIFDRDGTLNVRNKNGYVVSKSQLKFPSDINTLLTLSVKKVAIVTNQACVEKGLVSEEGMAKLTSDFIQFFQRDTDFTFFICTHDVSTACICRKPRPFLIEKAIEHFGINRRESVFIGDSKTDEETALNAGVDFFAVCWDSECWHNECLHTLENVTKFLNEGSSKK